MGEISGRINWFNSHYFFNFFQVVTMVKGKKTNQTGSFINIPVHVNENFDKLIIWLKCDYILLKKLKNSFSVSPEEIHKVLALSKKVYKHSI